MPKKSPKPVDITVGQNIRIIRLQRGMSQSELATSLGVTFQQVQKYEKGTNRVGGSRMFQVAEALGVAIEQLFEGAQPGKALPVSSPRTLLTDPHTLRVAQAFAALDDDKQRLAVLHLVESMAPAAKPVRRAA
jgi:transcriptional regulator with XRE-family HTH domain